MQRGLGQAPVAATPSARRTILARRADARGNTRHRMPARLLASVTVARTTKTGSGHFISLQSLSFLRQAMCPRDAGTKHRRATRNRHMLRDITVRAQRVIRGASHARQPPLRPAVRALAHPRPTGRGPRRGARRRAAARAAGRAAAVLSRRQDEGRAAEARAQPVHRAVPQDRFFHRPPRRGAAISRAQQGAYLAAAPHGRRHHRMRRDLHQRPRAGLPAFAMRPAHHDQHPVGARR